MRLGLGLGLSASRPPVEEGGNQEDEMELISSDSVVSPVEYFDITLPAGYSSFLIVMNDYSHDLESDGQQLACAVSADAGATFANDLDGYDTYISAIDTLYGMTDFRGADASDAVCSVTSEISNGTNTRANINLWIDPGSAERLFSVYAASRQQISGAWGMIHRTISLDPGATITPTPARQNLIRFFPYGNGDADPPTSEMLIESCSWTLYGIPEPA